MRGDLLTVFKMFKGFTSLKPDDYFTIDRSSITRNNGFKIIGNHFITNEAKYFFLNRVVNIWNGLPSNVVNSSTIETFKNRLGKYLECSPRLAMFVAE